MIVKHSLFQRAEGVMRKILSAGYEAYFVGGSVRDAILKRTISDIDIASSATPDEIKAIFSHTVDIGIEHGTVLVLDHGTGYEITTFRTEAGYEDFRHPSSVTFVRSLKEDLKRRDFTINAFALSMDYELIDYFEGLNDLKLGIIRCVGNPFERFNEDALRMLRAVRFMSQLEFSLDIDTKEAIKELCPNLERIAIERIYVEWIKLITQSGKKQAVEVFIETNLYMYCPLFQDKKESLMKLADFPLTHLTEVQTWVLLAYFSKLSEKEVRKLLKAWKTSNQLTKDVLLGLELLYKRFEQSYDYFIAFRCPKEIALQIEELLPFLGRQVDYRSLEERYSSLPIHSLSDLAINGYDIITLLQLSKKGPIIGEILQALQEAVLAEHLPNHCEVLSNFVLNWQEK